MWQSDGFNVPSARLYARAAVLHPECFQGLVLYIWRSSAFVCKNEGLEAGNLVKLSFVGGLRVLGFVGFLTYPE